VRCIQLSEAAQSIIVSVDYRLCPENPFPAPTNDAYAALEWVAGEAKTLGIDLDDWRSAGQARRLSSCRDSVGGPGSRRTKLCYQFLCSPVLDDRLQTPSAGIAPRSQRFSRFQAERMWKFYLGQPAGLTSIYAAPARAASLKGLPPAYILRAVFDHCATRLSNMACDSWLKGSRSNSALCRCPHAFDLSVPTAARSRQVLAEMQEHCGAR